MGLNHAEIQTVCSAIEVFFAAAVAAVSELNRPRRVAGDDAHRAEAKDAVLTAESGSAAVVLMERRESLEGVVEAPADASCNLDTFEVAAHKPALEQAQSKQQALEQQQTIVD